MSIKYEFNGCKDSIEITSFKKCSTLKKMVCFVKKRTKAQYTSLYLPNMSLLGTMAALKFPNLRNVVLGGNWETNKQGTIRFVIFTKYEFHGCSGRIEITSFNKCGAL